MSKAEANKVERIKEILGDWDLIQPHVQNHLIYLLGYLARNRLMEQAKDKEVTKIEELLPKSPQLAIDLNKGIIIGYDNQTTPPTAMVVAIIPNLTYEKPIFSIIPKNKKEYNENSYRLLRMFILREEIIPEHAKLILPVVKAFLYGSIVNLPGLKSNPPKDCMPKETIEINIKYFKIYIRRLEKAIEENSTIKVVYF